MPRRSTPKRQIDEALKSMPVSHLMCRDYGHAWEPFTAARLANGRGFEQTLRCARCHTTRRRYLDSRGDVVTGGYGYVEGYLIHGLGRLTGADRGALRVASLEATLNIHLAEEAS